MSYTVPAFTNAGGNISTGYSPPAFTDVGGELFASGTFDAVIDINFSAEIEAEINYIGDLLVSIPLVFSGDFAASIAGPSGSVAILVPLTFSGDINATGLGDSGEVVVPKIYGVMTVRF